MMRRGLQLVLLALLLMHGYVSFGVWRVARDPGTDRGWVQARPEVIAPLVDAALRRGLEGLSDTELAPGARFATYQGELRNGREWLIRSLDANPVQPRALATLATVEYELDPAGATALDETQRLMGIAATLAPQEPRVQAQLGELLLRVGRGDEGLRYLARSVTLDGSLADRTVQLATAYGLSADAIYAALPRNARTLTAMGHALLPADPQGYVDLVEEALDGGSLVPTRQLLSGYGAAALQLGQATRLADRMESIGPLEDPEVEAERSVQLGRCALALGRPGEAFDRVAEGLGLHPEAYYYATLLGDVAVAAGRPEDAIQAYRKGLSVLARGSGQPAPRAHLYRRLGEVYDGLGQTDLAFDQYRRALDLRPDEPHALRRMEQMTRP